MTFLILNYEHYRHHPNSASSNKTSGDNHREPPEGSCLPMVRRGVRRGLRSGSVILAT